MACPVDLQVACPAVPRVVPKAVLRVVPRVDLKVVPRVELKAGLKAEPREVRPVDHRAVVALVAAVLLAAAVAVMAVVSAVLADQFPEQVAPEVLAVPEALRVAQNVIQALLVEPGVLVDPTRAVTAALVSIPEKARQIARQGWKKHSRSRLAATTRFWLMSSARCLR